VAGELEVPWLENRGKKPVANADLWRQLDEATQAHRVRWRWVKGHSGDPGNERADTLANLAIDEMLNAP
jgi:ribonuclease HI